MDFYNEIPSPEAVGEMARKYHAREEEGLVTAESRRPGQVGRPGAHGAARLIQEIIDGMKEIRSIFIMLLPRSGTQRRAFRLLIAEKTRNIHIMEQAHERLTGIRPLTREPNRFFIRSFCGGLRQAFLEQSAVIDRISRLNRLALDPPLRIVMRTVGDSELRSLSEINRVYSQCR